jgi:hypothetical protein
MQTGLEQVSSGGSANRIKEGLDLTAQALIGSSPDSPRPPGSRDSTLGRPAQIDP